MPYCMGLSLQFFSFMGFDMLYHSFDYSDNRVRESPDLVKTRAITVNAWLKVFYKENPKAPRRRFLVELSTDGARIYTKSYKLVQVYKEFIV
jgi:hypothetical protein